MNQKQLLREIKTSCGCTHEASRMFLRAFQRALATGLNNDKLVKLPGLGIFQLEHKAIKFHNIVSNQLETSPVRPRVKFKPGIAMKTALAISAAPVSKPAAKPSAAKPFVKAVPAGAKVDKPAVVTPAEPVKPLQK